MRAAGGALPGRLAVGVPLAWFGVFFALPLGIVLAISLAEKALGQPPYTALAAWSGEGVLTLRISFANYRFLLEDPLYREAWISSAATALRCTLLCLCLGYPLALAITRFGPAGRMLLLTLVIVPFWTSFLLRVYAWMGLLATGGTLHGVANALLLGLGLAESPVALARGDLAVHLAIVHAYLPFMVLPLYAALERQDVQLVEAAQDLGAGPFTAFRRVTLPLSLPGVGAGCMLVFLPALGEFVVPDLLGDADVLMIGKVLWDEFSRNVDWPLASALATLMLAGVGLVWLLERLAGRRAAGGTR